MSNGRQPMTMSTLWMMCFCGKSHHRRRSPLDHFTWMVETIMSGGMQIKPWHIACVAPEVCTLVGIQDAALELIRESVHVAEELMRQEEPVCRPYHIKCCLGEVGHIAYMWLHQLVTNSSFLLAVEVAQAISFVPTVGTHARQSLGCPGSSAVLICFFQPTMLRV